MSCLVKSDVCKVHELSVYIHRPPLGHPFIFACVKNTGVFYGLGPNDPKKKRFGGDFS